MKPISHYFIRQSVTETVDPEEDMEEEGDENINEGPSGDNGSSSTAGRKYNFNPQWQKTFPWLIFDDNLMYCKYCRGQKQAGNSAFVSGNPHFKRDTVQKHSKSRRHALCRDAYIARENKESATMQAAVRRQVLLSEEEKRRQLKIKFNIAYYIAKEETAFVKFGPLITLHKKNGVDINPTYDNDKRCAEMIGQIADTMKGSLAEKLRAAHYLSVLIDGDSDISNTECEIVYVRLLENGKPVNLLVGQQSLEHSHALGKKAVSLFVIDFFLYNI